MKPYRILVLLSLLSIPGLQGDGIPVDRATMTVLVDHSIIMLTEAQQEEIEVLGTLTFTPDQWKRLRTFEPNCPKQIQDIFPPSYSDSVETDAFVIQMAPDRVAVPHRFNYFPTIRKREGAWLRVDRRGQFYSDRRLIPYQKLLEMLKATTDEQGGDGHLRLEVPLGLKLDSSVLKTRVDRLFSVARAAGWTIESPEPEAEQAVPPNGP